MTTTAEATCVRPVVLEGREVLLEPLTREHARGLLEAAGGPRETYGYTTVPIDERAMLGYIKPK